MIPKEQIWTGSLNERALVQLAGPDLLPGNHHAVLKSSG